ncbi:complement factor H-like isoform X2 [Elgaria multicarinata webbii]|uniref:complement factor H-like isoform X2 n=1 Tax=Elgaria multicarinata webbii TaxID=159646 RepID=UPI002FCD3E01
MSWLRYISLLLLWKCCTSDNECAKEVEVDFGKLVKAHGVGGGEDSHAVGTIECLPGYFLEGSEEVKCTYHEKWGPLPKCLAPCIITKEQLDDKHLFLPGYRRYSRVIQHNSTVEFTCGGTRPSVVRTCVDGHIDLPSCSPVCASLPNIDFGRLLRAHAVGGGDESYGAATFECNPGYVLEGSKEVECRHQQWGRLPKCLAPCIITKEQLDNKDLFLPGYRRHSHAIQHNDTVELICGQSNAFIPSAVSTCVDGHIDLPTCYTVCASPPNIDFGRLLRGHAIGGGDESYGAATFECNPGYVLEGSGEVKCSRQKWGPLPKCLAPCMILKDLLDANHILWSLGRSHSTVIPHNSTLEFQCKEGYATARSLAERTCVDGHIDLPSCLPGSIR